MPVLTDTALNGLTEDHNSLMRTEVAMHADCVELSWDDTISNWLVRIEVGEEVVHRDCTIPKNSDEQILRSAAKKTLADEGYEPDASQIIIRR